MTEVTMTLPDNLAQEARAAGLLTPQALEAMLRETLRKQRVDELFTAMGKMAAVDMAPLTEAEMQAEIAAARAERRARRS
jgi:post-segregation antitoxin (ccd killing protein)